MEVAKFGHHPDPLIDAEVEVSRSAATTEGATMTVSRYDDNTWAVYDRNGKVLEYGFFTSQDAHDWIETDAAK